MTEPSLRYAILTDQLFAVRKTVAISMPVNMLLGAASLLVAMHADKSATGVVWFVFSSIVNVLRLVLCRLPVQHSERQTDGPLFGLSYPGVVGHLHLHTILALLSGLVWGSVPVMCDWYTSPQTLFYLAVICGITAGAVTHGLSYARVPMCFITPPLISACICLVLAGGFERNMLAATVLLYLAALIRGTRVGEALIVKDSQLKNEATALSRSLEIANQQKTVYAEEMQSRAVRDQLTGLLNRRGFTEMLEQMSAAHDDGCLILLDLDGFKSVNDAFGHKSGDRVLIEVARRLTDVLVGEAILARIGGDEFAILLRQRIAEEEAEAIATQVITAISIPFSKLDPGRVGVSAGVYLGSINEIDEVMIYTDAALYAAKKQGRNHFRLFDEQLQLEAELNRDIERDLAKALANETIEIHYQPIMADGGKRVDTFEALLRWQHPQHGWIAPPNIIDVAAMTGLSESLLRFIVRDATIMALMLKSIGRDDVRLAVNVSPRELAQIAVDDLILSKFEKMGVSPSTFELEITEDVAIDPRLVQSKLNKLSGTGVRIAIDDFGMGYSSLGSLQQIRADRVKIDKVFVTGTTLASAHRSLLDAVLRVSEAYGFDVVAEGVETEDDLKTMQRLGCSRMQGYLFARPMPKDKALTWLRKKMAYNADN